MTAASTTNSVLPSYVVKSKPNGPVISRLQSRALLLWMLVSVIGLLLASTGSPGWTAFGVGLVFPGAGLAYAGHPILALLNLLLVPIACIVWLLIGAFIAPLAVWLGGGVLAALLVVPGTEYSWVRWAAPAVSIGLVAWVRYRSRSKLPAKTQVVKDLNAHLMTVPLREADSQWRILPPLQGEEIGAYRYILDLALQPIDRWDGFTTKDQFREAAWRYQLYSLGNALACLRATRLPAFRGYVQQAQRNAIVKMTQRRVWDYWLWESLWGNLQPRRDPMEHENIMLTGYFAVQLGAYTITTGDRSFDDPRSLPFRWDQSTVFDYSYPKIAESLVRNFGKTDMVLFPCEPNWVFTYCNDQGIAGLKLYDRSHGTTLSDEIIPAFLRRLQEDMTTADAKPVAIMANRVGLCLPGSGGAGLLSSGWLRSIYARHIGLRDLEHVHHRHLKRKEDGSIDMAVPALDPGDYTKNGGAFSYASIMQSARELGDDALYEWARQQYDALGVTQVNGALRWHGSTFANLTSHVGRFGDKDLWYRLGNCSYPQEWLSGPMLEHADYPDVLVLSAWNEADRLHLVVEPGNGQREVTLGLSQLQPHCRYEVEPLSQTLVADAEGCVELRFRLDGNTQITVSRVHA